MRRNFLYLDKRFGIKRLDINLFIIIFVAALLSKGAVIFAGSAIDDYAYLGSLDLQVYFSQGRYITGAIAWIINSLGANINDMYFSLGIVTLLLQAAFIVSILRFVGIEASSGAGLVGAIMISHPYLTEILTFRMALPAYSVALIFSIIALEMVTKSPANWGTRALSLLACVAMLFTYQVFLNYFAVAIIFAFIYGQVLHCKNDHSLAISNVSRERALTLTIISTISAIGFVLITWLNKALGLVHGANRTNLITLDKVPERIDQISSALVNIYWSAEPVFSGWLKTLVALMLVSSVVIIFWHLLIKNNKEISIGNSILTGAGFLMLFPMSLGVIIPFGDWWPVPRVVAHVSIIIGLIFLIANSCIQNSSNRHLKSIIFTLGIIVLVGFVFLSNKILADQQRINRWDKMMANRIISRLEMFPDFNKVRFVYINGGFWAFPAKLGTIQGDMNISAFYPAYSKVPLLSDASGYKFENAVGPKAAIGEAYCKNSKPWPYAESVTINGDIAIVCLQK